jgi:hypothetical protein
MTPLVVIGRRGRSLAAGVALGAALAVAACGGRGQVPAEEYDPDAPKAQDAAPPPAPAPPAAPGAPPAPPAPMLTPEQDSIQEEQAFARRKASMESYEDCMAKVATVEEPARTTLRAACARRRDAQP